MQLPVVVFQDLPLDKSLEEEHAGEVSKELPRFRILLHAKVLVKVHKCILVE